MNSSAEPEAAGVGEGGWEELTLVIFIVKWGYRWLFLMYILCSYYV